MTPNMSRLESFHRSRGHSEMGSRDHGMVEFGVRIPVAPFDSAEYSLAHGRPRQAESNVVSKRSASNDIHLPASALSRFVFRLHRALLGRLALHRPHRQRRRPRVGSQQRHRAAHTAARRPVELVYRNPPPQKPRPSAANFNSRVGHTRERAPLSQATSAVLRSPAKRHLR